MHSGEEKEKCSRYRHNHGLNDGTPRPSSAFRLTHRKTSTASHLYTSHDEDDLQQMHVVKVLKDEIRDLKQLLHNSNQQINRMKVSDKEIKESSKDQIFELQQKNSELQKQQQEREQQEALLRRTLEESSEIIEIKKKEMEKLHELLSKAIHLSEIEEKKNRQLLSELSQLNKDKHDLQQQVETIEETIRAELADEELEYRKELFRLQQTSANIEPSLKQLIIENEKVKTNNENLEKVAVEIGSRFDSIKTNYNREKAQLEDTQTRLREISEDNQSKDKQVFELRTKLEHTEKKFQVARMNDEQSIQDLESEKSKLASWYDSELSTYKQLKTDIEKRVHELSKENRTLKELSKESETRTAEDIKIMKNLLQKTETELEENKARYLEERLRTKHEIDGLKSNLKDTEAMVTKEKQERLNLENEKQSRGKKITQLQQIITSLEQQIEQHRQENEKYKTDIDHQKQLRDKKSSDASELRDTKTRLSKCIGGDELTNNNPNILYLSDINRPSKLAERYKDLYDNQWTDAYEILEESVGGEEQIIKILLEILIETKRFCDHHTEMEMDHILKVITRKDRWQQSEVPVSVIQYIMDRRKSTVAETMKTKYKEYVDDLRKSQTSFVKHALRIDAYLQECFEVCWLMAIQDPPVVLAPVLKQGDPFKADLYSAYKVIGKIVDYVVWPALLLHTNGPTLTKGVAQGMKKH